MLLSILFGALGCVAVSLAQGANGVNRGAELPVLGAESFEERERAAMELWSKGDEARNLLTALTLANDPEQAWRARRLLRWVDLEMTPETPKEIVDLVENYLIAPSAKKREIIYNRLLGKEAYVQLFRLPKHVSDQTVARNLAERVAELAGQVAEEKILAGKDWEALAILEDARNAEAGHLRWVSLASALGMREELWGGLSTEDRMRFARWEGDLELIESLASPEHEIQFTLQLMNGNPMSFLEKEALRNDQVGIRTRISKAIWEGKEGEEETVKLLDALISGLEQDGLEKSEDVLVLLTQLGYADEVLPYFEDYSPVDMFEYYHRQERLEEAFRCIGLRVGELVPQEWIDESLALVREDFELSNKGCRRLLSVAQFFVERGHLDEAVRLLEALYGKMDKLGVSEVNNFLAYLGGRQSNIGLSGYPEFAIQKAEAREEDVFKVESFLSESFFAEESVFILYRFLGEREVAMTDWERVRAIFALFAREVVFPEEEETAILKELEESARENSSEGEWGLLMEVGLIRGEIELVERAAREVRGFMVRNEFLSGNLASLLFADGRFGEAAEIWKELLEEDPSRFDLMDYLAVALELSGKKGEAQEWLLKIEKLALGDGSWLVSLGEIWGEVGDWERQHDYYQRAFLLFKADPAESRQWVRQLYLFAESARHAGNWKQSAACREVYNTLLRFDLVGSPSPYFTSRGQLDITRAMAAFEEGDTERGEQILDRLTDYCGHNSMFADEVFPVLRRAGLHEQAERLWARVSSAYRRSMELFPDGHNAHNTAAWVASRAACDLDEAMQWVNRALEERPKASAYLDTRAEVYFAQGNREEALKSSEMACKRSDGMGFLMGMQTLRMLRAQYRHFRDDPFPLPTEEQGQEQEEE